MLNNYSICSFDRKSAVKMCRQLFLLLNIPQLILVILIFFVWSSPILIQYEKKKWNGNKRSGCLISFFSSFHFSSSSSSSSVTLFVLQFCSVSTAMIFYCFFLYCSPIVIGFFFARCTRNKLHNIWYSLHLLLPAIKCWMVKTRKSIGQRWKRGNSVRWKKMRRKKKHLQVENEKKKIEESRMQSVFIS